MMNWKKAVNVWLLVGLFMLLMQIVIGGITRLTGSGLSITEWDIVFGTLPPLNQGAWNDAFELYKATPQYEKINEGMSLSDFKFIYFWEYIHRLWARIMGFVFIVPFSIFWLRGLIPKSLRVDLGVVVLLAALAASFGWIMVASGLVNRPWVNAYKLALHLCIGISVYAYLLWTYMKYSYKPKTFKSDNKGLVWCRVLFGLLIAQLFFGGVMSGMRAALIYPTWPLIGDSFIPTEIFSLSNWTAQNFNEYESTSFVFSLMHTVHRLLGYLIVGFSIWYYVNFIRSADGVFRTSFRLLGVAIVIQVLLGIMTLLTSIGTIPVLWGVLHQFVAVVVLSLFLWHYFVNLRSHKLHIN